MEILIENLNKQINGVDILKNINLNIKKGEVFGLIGPNGSGKTTLLRIILNLYRPSSGNVFVNNVNVQNNKFNEIKNKIGFLLDNIGLFKDLSVWDNMEFFDRIYNKNSSKNIRNIRITRLLKEFDLYEKKDERINFFSRGMKQRLALARSLINNPELLILDEPSRGLDLEGKLILRNFIKLAKERGCTIFINSHDLIELQKMCTNIAFIDNGKIILAGKIEDIENNFCENSYYIKSNELLKQMNRLSNIENINVIKKGNSEFIILVKNDTFDISDWIARNNIKINELKKINKNLEEIYTDVISKK